MGVLGIHLYLKGDLQRKIKVPKEPLNRNLKVKSKGVYREVESEGSWRQ
jgi:hypothetical protein